MIRFICNNEFDSSTKIQITAQSTDSLDGAVGGNYEIKKAFDGVMLYAPISGSWYIIQKKAQGCEKEQ